MRLPARHFALGPILWPSIDRAEQTAPGERSSWEYGVASAASVVDNNRGIYSPLLAVVFAVAGLFVGPGPLVLRVLFAALIGLCVSWLLPTALACAEALRAPYKQRNLARGQMKQLELKQKGELDSAHRAYEAQVDALTTTWERKVTNAEDRAKAEREAFDSKWAECEDLRGKLGEAEVKIEEQTRLLLLEVANREGLSGKLDEMVKRGFALYDELNTGPEPTATDEEGRGISFPFFPPDSKWEPVYEFDREARQLLREHDPALMFTYADGVNAQKRQARRIERQRDQAQKELRSGDQMKFMVERLHRRPADEIETLVAGLVAVKKALAL
jgi:hypothetical protein